MNIRILAMLVTAVIFAVFVNSCNSWFASACKDTPEGIKCDKDSAQYRAAVKAAEISSGKKFVPSEEKKKGEQKPREFY